MEPDKRVAEILLDIKAVTLRPSQPFRFVSGILSPIYCDNRLLMSRVPERREVIGLMAEKAREIGLGSFGTVAGIASSGIAPAAWLAETLEKPMIYVRKQEKDHGRENLIEGKMEQGEKVLMVEDLISTGGSSLKGIEGVRSQGGVCEKCLAIFTYEMEKARKGFEEANCKLFPMTTFSTLVGVALEKSLIKEEEMQSALDWSKDPQGWGKSKGFE